MLHFFSAVNLDMVNAVEYLLNLLNVKDAGGILVKQGCDVNEMRNADSFG